MKTLKHLFGLSVAITAGMGAHLALAQPAAASLEFCNESGKGKAYIAIAYSLGNNRWQSEGWYNIEEGECITAVKGNLRNRYYYYFVETDSDATITGDHKFCVSSKKFTFSNADTKCVGSNSRWEWFEELDTGDSKDFSLDIK